MPGIAVRVDAKTYSTGMHNVVRSIALAIELSKAYYDVYFITKFDASYEKIKKEGFNVFKISDTSPPFETAKSTLRENIGENPAEVIELLIKHNITCLIVDLPSCTEQYIKQYEASVKRIVLIEDAFRFKSSANVIINGSINAEEIEYPHYPYQQVLLGSEYCLIDYEIRDLVPTLKLSKIIKDIFLYTASHDKMNVTPALLKLLLTESVTQKFRYHVVIDNSFPGYQEVLDLAEYWPNVEIHDPSRKLLHILKDCQVGITNDIFSIYRLLACGIPTISFLSTDNDNVYNSPINEMIENIWEGKFIGLAAEEDNLTQNILKKLNKLLESHSMRLTLSERGKKAIDGLGAARAAEKLAKILK